MTDLINRNRRSLRALCISINSEIELKVKDSIALGEVEEQLRQIDGMQSVHRI